MKKFSLLSTVVGNLVRVLSDRSIFKVLSDKVLYRLLSDSFLLRVLRDRVLFRSFRDSVLYRVLSDRVLFRALLMGSSLASWILSKVFSPLFWYANDRQAFIKTPISESLHNYYWQKQRYSTNTEVVVGCNLQFIGIATGFPGSLHDSTFMQYY